MRTGRIVVVFAAVFAVLLSVSLKTPACPFCSQPQLTLSEQIAQNDAVVLAQWVSAQKPEEQVAGSTTFEVLQVVKAPQAKADPKLSAPIPRDPLVVKAPQAKAELKESKSNKSAAASDRPEKGQTITLSRYRAGQAGDLFLLLGTQGTMIEWSSPLEVTETSFNYVVQAPSPELPEEKRLVYFLKFVEFPDPVIATDAYSEFAKAKFESVVSLGDHLPVEKVREWVASPDTPATRLGLYGLMLGLCGNEDDAQMMEKKITEPTEEFRLGIDGVMFGYLQLTGEKGLDLIDETKLKDKNVPFSETYAAMQALRFMWTYGKDTISRQQLLEAARTSPTKTATYEKTRGTIPKARLRESMRLLLDRPELADLVIADLARWKDWSVQDRLMNVYGAGEYDIPSIKRAVVRFLLVCSKDLPSGDGAEVPAHVTLAKKHLETLRKKDPKTVQEAERFLFLN